MIRTRRVQVRMNAFAAIYRMSWSDLSTDCVLIVFVAFFNSSQMECCWTETTVVVELLIWILYREELDVLNHCR